MSRPGESDLLQACPKCGAANGDRAELCYVCDAPLSAADEILEPVAVSSSEPQWRLEVAHRLEAYRARRRRPSTSLRASGPGAEDSQEALPFVPGNEGESSESAPMLVSGARHADRSRKATSRAERRVGIEIAVVQPALDFSAAAQHLPASTALVPVAPLDERIQAGVMDAVFLLASYGGFLLLFGSLGGQFSFGKYDAVVYAATFFLFYAQYFALFTALNGCTPGMHLYGLRVVSFDGGEPSWGQLLWRSFGYLVSAATLCLGFLWALWDDDHLTWQDRISQTYVTDSVPPGTLP